MQLIFIALLSFFQAQDIRQPRFEDCVVQTTFKGTPAKLNLHGDEHCIVFNDCSIFRAKIERELQKGPNFADHYRIILWSDHASCFEFGIFDLASGFAHFPRQGGCCRGLVFRRNSNLIIIDPTDSTYYDIINGAVPDEKLAEHQKAPFLLWQSDTLKPIYSTRKPLEFEYKLHNIFIH